MNQIRGSTVVNIEIVSDGSEAAYSDTKDERSVQVFKRSLRNNENSVKKCGSDSVGKMAKGILTYSTC